jgi:inorganic pyrophosphatase
VNFLQRENKCVPFFCSEAGKLAKVDDWGNAQDAKDEIMKSVAAYEAAK